MKMKIAKITTGPVQPYDFLTSVFLSGASLLSQMALFPIDLGIRRVDTIELSEAIKMKELVITTGWSALGPACLGQYSLINQTSVFALAKLDVYLRQATETEAMLDVDEFGEQVMGEIVKDEPERVGKTIIKLSRGQSCYYQGPSRVVQANFTTRVENGSFPDLATIKEIGEEINALATTLQKDVKSGDGMVEDGYYFVFANSGKIHVAKVSKLNKFPEFSGLQHVGHMEMREEKLFFIPAKNSGPPADFSENIYQHDL